MRGGKQQADEDAATEFLEAIGKPDDTDLVRTLSAQTLALDHQRVDLAGRRAALERACGYLGPQMLKLAAGEVIDEQWFARRAAVLLLDYPGRPLLATGWRSKLSEYPPSDPRNLGVPIRCTRCGTIERSNTVGDDMSGREDVALCFDCAAADGREQSARAELMAAPMGRAPDGRPIAADGRPQRPSKRRAAALPVGKTRNTPRARQQRQS